MPIVYFHGLGFGLLQNHLLIKHLVSTLASHPIVVPLSPHTSQSIFHERHLRPSTKEETVQTIKKICTKWGFWKEGKMDERSGRKRGGWGGVSLLSHSNGSVAHSWSECSRSGRDSTADSFQYSRIARNYLRETPSLIPSFSSCVKEVSSVRIVQRFVQLIFDDRSDICHSFCYRKPATVSKLSAASLDRLTTYQALELLLYYFIASEVGIANYIQRVRVIFSESMCSFR
jgi:hypothetical protein